MGKKIIRSAELADANAISTLKSNYVQVIYRGFIADHLLKLAVPAYYDPQVHDWLTSPRFQLDVLEEDGQIIGWIVYGSDHVASDHGLIREMGLDPLVDPSYDTLLFQHALQALAKQGYPQVYQWVLRNNFRLRFRLEHVGFKRDGGLRTVTMEGQKLEITRYVHQM